MMKANNSRRENVNKTNECRKNTHKHTIPHETMLLGSLPNYKWTVIVVNTQSYRLPRSAAAAAVNYIDLEHAVGIQHLRISDQHKRLLSIDVVVVVARLSSLFSFVWPLLIAVLGGKQWNEHKRSVYCFLINRTEH